MTGLEIFLLVAVLFLYFSGATIVYMLVYIEDEYEDLKLLEKLFVVGCWFTIPILVAYYSYQDKRDEHKRTSENSDWD